MSILDRFTGATKRKSSHVMITSIGKRKAEESSGGLRFAILSHLEDNGSSSYSELSETTGKDIRVIKTICKSMKKDGEIKESNSENNSDE